MQQAAWVIAPLVVAGVLGLSALAKAGKGESLRSVIANLALPTWLLPSWLARAVPGIELVVALALLSPWRLVSGAASLAALGLLLAYWLLIARGLSIHPRPSCGCFGEVDQPISGRTLVRNTLLVVAGGAGVALTVSGGSAWSLLAQARATDWLWLALAACACAVSALVGGRTESAADAAPPSPRVLSDTPVAGAPIARAERGDVARDRDDASAQDDLDYVRVPTPQLLLHDPGSGPVTLPELSAHRAQLLIFVNCYCASTTETLAATTQWQQRLELVDVRVVFSVPIHEGGPVLPDGTLLDHRGLTRQALELSGSPSAVLLGADGYLAGGPVSGTANVHSFVDDIAEALSQAQPDPEPARD